MHTYTHTHRQSKHYKLHVFFSSVQQVCVLLYAYHRVSSIFLFSAEHPCLPLRVCVCASILYVCYMELVKNRFLQTDSLFLSRTQSLSLSSFSMHGPTNTQYSYMPSKDSKIWYWCTEHGCTQLLMISILNVIIAIILWANRRENTSTYIRPSVERKPCYRVHLSFT